MSVRKRVWTTSKGETKEAWIVDYVDQEGDRHIETFARKKEADDYHKQVGHEVMRGVHTAPSKSITVAQAAAINDRPISPACPASRHSPSWSREACKVDCAAH